MNTNANNEILKNYILMYKNESREDLIKRIVILSSLELSDRCFANQCVAGPDILKVTSLFDYIEELHKLSDNDPVIDDIYKMMDEARTSFRFIKNGISEINDDNRYAKLSGKFDTLPSAEASYLNVRDLTIVINKLKEEDKVISLSGSASMDVITVAIFYLMTVGECKILNRLLYPDANGRYINIISEAGELCYYYSGDKRLKNLKLTNEILHNHKLTPAGKEFIDKYL